MYPRLQNCRVRGAEKDFYLHQYLNGSEFVLETLHAQILARCNGANSIEQLAVEFQQPKEDLLCFLKVIEEARLLEIRDELQKPLVFSQFDNQPYLREVHIDATGWCNLYGICKHCYGRASFQEATKNEMTLPEFLGVIDQMEEMNVSNCVLSGGEIFIRKDLPQLISHLAKRCVHLSGIFTNGTIYRQDVLDAINATGMKTSFFVSLDGHDSSINDGFRGRGSFTKTIEFIKRVVDAGFQVTVNTMVMRQNVKHLAEMQEYLKSLGIGRWRISVPREQGEAIINKDMVIPEWEDIFEAYEHLLRTALEKADRMKIQIGSIFKSELLEDPVFYLFRPTSNCCEYKRWSITIKPNGDVTPCTAFENLILGNVRRTSLREIWKTNLTQAFKNLPIEATECRDCDIKEYCGGGCRKIAWEIHGSTLAKDDNSCPLYDFAHRVIWPILEANGVKAEYLEKPAPYPFNPQMIDHAILR